MQYDLQRRSIETALAEDPNMTEDQAREILAAYDEIPLDPEHYGTPSGEKGFGDFYNALQDALEEMGEPNLLKFLEHPGVAKERRMEAFGKVESIAYKIGLTLNIPPDQIELHLKDMYLRGVTRVPIEERASQVSPWGPDAVERAMGIPESERQ